ncbi:9-cis-epoxycarotenoid dioxygenase-like protein [Halenospora varia]|nr:9-cis-epoxycarotenoid dioxygenase-like protein [Halenospora varia]
MAHIFSLADEVAPSYHEGRKSESQVKFPETGFFQGFNKPSRFEGDIFELEVTGNIPRDINGTFFRVQPDHAFPPVFEEDIHFNGDGNVSAFRFGNGHVDFRQRYVKTDRYNHEHEARKALFGRYRNPYTDHEAVKGVIRTAANTNVFFWRGVLLATKEDGPPFAMDPVTLETLGRYDFDGQVKSPTFTAHPKIDPVTGEMVCFGYEAGGNGYDGSCEIVVYTIDKDGKKIEEMWYEAPFCGMIHDCGISENYLVLPLTPLKVDGERVKKGGNHFAWDPDEDQWYGVIPRRGGKREDIVWLRSKNAFHGHVAGCYENSDGHIVFDLTVADGNVFFWFPPDNGPHESLTKRNMGKMTSDTYRWIFDPKLPTKSYVEPAKLFGINGEFSRIDDRLVTKEYNHFWQLQIDTSRPYDFQKCGSPAGGLFNVIGHYNWGKEGEGYLMALLNHLDVLRNDILIFDALAVSKGPIAVVHLPMKLRLGVHGNFVEQGDIEEWESRKDEIKLATEPLPWQVEFEKARAEEKGKQQNGE